MIYYAKAGTRLPNAERGLGWDCWFQNNGPTVDVQTLESRSWSPSYQFKDSGVLFTYGLPIVDEAGHTHNSILSLDEGL